MPTTLTRLTQTITTTALLIALTLITACGGDHKDKGHAHKDHDHKDHGHKDHDHKDHAHKDEAAKDKKDSVDDDDHVHVAPRGGTLVELGDHAANVELVIDAERKLFSLYALDAHAENAAKIAQPEVELIIYGKPPMADFTIKLAAVANENTGETVGDTSHFQVDLAALKGLTEFEGEIKDITVRGGEYKDVKFKFKATPNTP